MNALKLLKFLTELQEQGVDLDKVNLSYRHNYDSDVEDITDVHEGLCDEITNNELREIMFITDGREI